MSYCFPCSTTRRVGFPLFFSALGLEVHSLNRRFLLHIFLGCLREISLLPQLIICLHPIWFSIQLVYDDPYKPLFFLLLYLYAGRDSLFEFIVHFNVRLRLLLDRTEHGR